ncbi:MAG: hypothetical protein OSA84_06770 [Akkermansiaceae bacterium]|nr:hypothetical protein [Akkermansiaceae bacterium]
MMLSCPLFRPCGDDSEIALRGVLRHAESWIPQDLRAREAVRQVSGKRRSPETAWPVDGSGDTVGCY